MLVQLRHSLYAFLLNVWLAPDYDYLPMIPSLIIGVCKEKTQSAASPNNVCVVSQGRDPGNRSVFFSRSTVRGLTLEDVISLSDNPDLHPYTTIMLTDAEKLYIYHMVGDNRARST
jgi:hypothetical protein